MFPFPDFDDGHRHGHDHEPDHGHGHPESLLEWTLHAIGDRLDHAVDHLVPDYLHPAFGDGHGHPDPHAGVAGTPHDDAVYWHQQRHPDTCAVVSQEFVLDAVTGRHFDEEQLRREAAEHGWYTEGGGTPLYHVGDLLELHGVPVTREFHVGLDQIEHRLAAGEKVIVGVEAEQIWSPAYHDRAHELLTAYPWVPGQGANHAVEVIGVDRSDPAHPVVVLNDPGTPAGCGLRVPAGTFADAHAASGQFAVTTALHAPAAVPSLGGYYNGDGTYHYDSDNTDRDQQTGAIVRRW